MKPITRTSGMNRTEAAYAMQLEALKQAGEVRDYLYEAVTLKLANDTRYTPDFFVVYPDRFECHEVKGFWRDDARVKIKVAAQRFPWMRFLAIQWVNKEWKIEEF
jgi:hypothetical protein